MRELSWAPQNKQKGALTERFFDNRYKPPVTKSEDDLNVTCMMVKIPAGVKISDHIHQEPIDILYPIQGQAGMNSC
jgi:quercetin dioxygenase-like cupin family protein